MILVTGGAGYIGSATTLALREAGFSTIVLDDFSKGHEEAVFGDFLERGDICYRRFLDNVFASYSIDAVIHLAARSVVSESMTEAETYYKINVEGSLNLLSAMKQAGVNKLVFSSTGGVYGNPINCPLDEDAQKNTTNVYSDTKLFIESVLSRYHYVYGLNSIILRYFNVAGADKRGRTGENHSPETHLIPLALDAASGKAPYLNIYGDDYITPDGTCIRDYVHVMDVAKGHVFALKKLLSENNCFDVYNLGSGVGYSVKEIISEIERVTNKKINTKIVPRRIGDPPSLIASIEKAEKELGWKPRYGLEEIIETAWEWYNSSDY